MRKLGRGNFYIYMVNWLSDRLLVAFSVFNRHMIWSPPSRSISFIRGACVYCCRVVFGQTVFGTGQL